MKFYNLLNLHKAPDNPKSKKGKKNEANGFWNNAAPLVGLSFCEYSP